MKDRTKGNIALLLTAIVWGTGFVAQRIGNGILPPMAFNSIRQIMAGIVLCPVLAVDLMRSGYMSAAKNTAEQLARKRGILIRAGIVCGCFMTIGSMLQQIGLVTVSAGKSGFITSIYIVFVPLFSVILGVRVRRRSILCIALAMAGFAVMSLKGDLDTITAGDWITLASAAGFAAQIVAVNHFVDKGNAIFISVLQMFFCGIVGFGISFFVEHPEAAAVAAAMPVLIYATLVPTAMGYTFQIVGQKYTDSSTAALIMSLEAVFAAIFGMIVLGEMMSLREIAGSAIIFTATILGQKE